MTRNRNCPAHVGEGELSRMDRPRRTVAVRRGTFMARSVRNVSAWQSKNVRVGRWRKKAVNGFEKWRMCSARKDGERREMEPIWYLTARLCASRQSVSQSVSWFVSSANSTTLHESTAQYQSNFLFPFVFCLFTCTYFCLVNLLRITNVCRTVNQSLLETFQVNGMFAIEWERFRKHRKHT